MVAETVVGAHCVLTGPVATGLPLTLVHVDTHRLVPRCFEAIGADAAVAPQRVNALTWVAYTGTLNAFITVETLSGGGEAISRFTIAAVASWLVQTGCILLAHRSILTLVNIFANQQLVVVDEANGALTPEAANHVDAHSILTHSWDFPALININDPSCGDVDEISWSLTAAQDRKPVGAGHRTLFTGFIPCTANVVGAAAHLFGHVEGQLSVTCPVIGVKVPVAVALSHIHAVVPAVDLHVVHRADTGVVSNGVVALAWAAGTRSFTLIDIFTDSGIWVEGVASWTFTLEAAKGVDALSSLAQAWQLLALIDVFQDDSDGVWSEAFSSRTQRLVLG